MKLPALCLSLSLPLLALISLALTKLFNGNKYGLKSWRESFLSRSRNGSIWPKTKRRVIPERGGDQATIKLPPFTKSIKQLTTKSYEPKSIS